MQLMPDNPMYAFLMENEAERQAVAEGAGTVLAFEESGISPTAELPSEYGLGIGINEAIILEARNDGQITPLLYTLIQKHTAPIDQEKFVNTCKSACDIPVPSFIPELKPIKDMACNIKQCTISPRIQNGIINALEKTQRITIKNDIIYPLLSRSELIELSSPFIKVAPIIQPITTTPIQKAKIDITSIQDTDLFRAMQLVTFAEGESPNLLNNPTITPEMALNQVKHTCDNICSVWDDIFTTRLLKSGVNAGLESKMDTEIYPILQNACDQFVGIPSAYGQIDEMSQESQTYMKGLKERQTYTTKYNIPVSQCKYNPDLSNNRQIREDAAVAVATLGYWDQQKKISCIPNQLNCFTI